MITEGVSKRPVGRPRKYTDNQRIEALRIYKTDGPSAAEAATGISKSMITRWAGAAGIETEVVTRTHDAVEAAAAKRALVREEVRDLLLDKAKDLLGRMDKPHVDFKGKDADQVTYPIAPASAVSLYASATATLLQEYRKEMGEASGRLQVDFSAVIARIAIEQGLDPAEVEAETQRLMAETLEGTAERLSG